MSAVSCYQPVPDEQVYSFFAEFGATEESVKNDVKTLKEWLRKSPHLPAMEDDERLRNYLLKCKNSLEKTKSTIERYYITKTLMPEIFQNRDVCSKEMYQVVQTTVYIPCPKLTPEGYRIIIFKAFDNPDNYIPSSENILKAMQMVLDVLVKSDPVRGYILIEDMENVSPGFMAMLVPIMNKFISLVTKITPNRIHHIYLVNTAPYMDLVIRLARSFLSKKLNERMEIWKDKVTKFTEIYPKEVLPSDFGGDEKSLVELRDAWYEKLKTHQDWLKSIETETADLDKMPKDSSNDLQYDMNGSFRKLCVD